MLRIQLISLLRRHPSSGTTGQKERECLNARWCEWPRNSFLADITVMPRRWIGYEGCQCRTILLS
jgi:hypothetical protein